MGGFCARATIKGGTFCKAKKEIGQEKQENDSVIYDKDNNDMNTKGEAVRKNIKLENEESALYTETEQIFETKYKGLGII